ncbi:MYXO-CTERM sorting domain-containing protein [Myxococcota bacterium]|nr:MYXO-CTERM sorting domain-containing protein [Myxococcota bacterium]
MATTTTRRRASIALFLGITIFGATHARAETAIGAGTIGDTTWTAAGSPYRVTGLVTVGAGATLTIEPGVTVIFRGGLDVRGTLHAVGTERAPIELTGWNAAPGSWDGVVITGTADERTTAHRLEHVTVRYGGWRGANLTLTHAHATITHAVFADGSSDGIRGWAGGSVDVSDTAFTNNRGYAAFIDDFAPESHFARLSARGNGTDRVRLGDGVITGRRTLDRALPYELFGRIDVPAGAELVVAPGVEVHVASGGVLAEGRLTAIGTEPAPITFTTTPTRTWDGLELRGTAGAPSTDSTLAWIIVENAGWHGANVILRHAEVTIDHAIIRGAQGDGIRGWDGGVAHVTSSTISGNRDYALRFDDGAQTPRLADLTLTGNGEDRVAFGAGEVTGVRVLDAAIRYDLLGTLDVLAGAELVLEPGVELRVEGGFVVHGTLTALGTPTEPILITSTDPSPGTWDGLELRGTPTARNTGSVLDYVTIEYGGWHGANLVLVDAEATVSHSTFRFGSHDGVRVDPGANVSLSSSSFVGNAEYALRLAAGSRAPDLADLTASGNGSDRIGLAGTTVVGTRTFDGSLPWDLLGDLVVPRGATAVLEPGVRFLSRGNIYVDGTMIAVGTRTRPITFTAMTDNAWNGLRVAGTTEARNVGSRFEWVTFERGGGRGANLMLVHARVHVANARFEDSVADGVRGNDAGGSTIETSAFIGNGGAEHFAVHNETPDGEPIYAINDWWGATTGPTAGDTCNPAGGGARVSTGVVYHPFLATPDTDLGPVPPLGPLNAHVTPQRWFLPADGLTRAFVKIALHDELGLPVSGERVTLSTTRGDVTGGGLTDVAGEVFAYLVSDEPGDAVISAVLDAASECTPLRSNTSTITFTDVSDNPLFPDAEAPYFTRGIEWSPRPIVQGQPATIRAHLTNPSNTAVLVDATFNYAQLGLGLTFGPIGTVTGQIIPANGEGVVETTFVPPISGHFCIRFDYTATSVTAKSSRPKEESSDSAGSNATAKTGGMSKETENAAWEEADTAVELSHAGSLSIAAIETAKEHGVPPPSVYAEPGAQAHSSWVIELWKRIAAALGGNEGINPHRDKRFDRSARGLAGDDGLYTELPRPLYVEIAQVSAREDLSQERADAFNLWLRTFSDAVADARAMQLAAERSHAASAAGSVEWASQQAAAVYFYKARAASGFFAAADATDALLAVMRDEGMTSYYISGDDWRAWLDELAANGYSAIEREAARQHGFDDAEIDTVKAELLARDPETLAGDAIAKLAEVGVVFRHLGEALAGPSAIQGPPTSAGLSVSAGYLARVYETSSEITVGNPKATTETIDLRVRPIDLPPGWSVTLVPSSLELAPGATAPVKIFVRPDSPVLQGTTVRFAVEGFIGTELIGGVVEDLLIPRFVDLGAGCVGDGAKALGDVCACTLDCASGQVCAELEGAKTCRAACDLAASTCPSGQVCTEAGLTDVCVDDDTPPPPPPPAETEGGCGCTSSGRAHGGGLLLVLLVLVGLRPRRRR